MHQAHVQQIECLIALSEELHFGRTAERLGLSQARVSQLIAALESRVGARLVARTSRRVALTRAGNQFVKDVRPAYRGLLRTFTRARERVMRGALEELRIGFTGAVYEEITATFRALHDRYGVAVHTQTMAGPRRRESAVDSGAGFDFDQARGSTRRETSMVIEVDSSPGYS